MSHLTPGFWFLPRRGCTPEPRVALRAPWETELPTCFLPRRGCTTDRGGRVQPLRGRALVAIQSPRVREARPWALECNPFGVKTSETQPTIMSHDLSAHFSKIRRTNETAPHPYYWASFILVGDPGDLAAARPVLAETAPIELTAVGEPRQWWPWLAGSGVAVGGLIGGLIWRLSRRW
jgi:hypothetical protein